jgi:PTH1 family peptidyl-tRNA hydrolase
LRLIASWYRTPPESLLVIYDDMDLPFGKIRMRPFGGHGGHNGMRSVIATMTDRFPRIRVGVGRPTFRRAEDGDAIDHVLSPFNKAEREKLSGLIDAVADGVRVWLDEGTNAAMQILNNLEIA